MRSDASHVCFGSNGDDAGKTGLLAGRLYKRCPETKFSR